MSHQIFDGDGIFLNKQGDRMRHSDLSYKDYCTPTKADLLVLAFRRYLDRAVQLSEQAGHSFATLAINGESYMDNNDRSKLLDRYESHTKYCPVCSKEFERSKQRLKRWDMVQTAFVGAVGTSTTVLAMSGATSLFNPSIPVSLIRASGIASISTILGAKVAGSQKKN